MFNWTLRPILRRTRSSSVHLYSMAVIASAAVAGVVATAAPRYFFPILIGGPLSAYRIIGSIGAAIQVDDLWFRNNPLGRMRRIALGDIVQIQLASDRFKKTDFVEVCDSEGWHRIVGFAVPGEFGWSMQARNEPELARGELAELIRRTGLTVDGLVIADK